MFFQLLVEKFLEILTCVSLPFGDWVAVPPRNLVVKVVEYPFGNVGRDVSIPKSLTAETTGSVLGDLENDRVAGDTLSVISSCFVLRFDYCVKVLVLTISANLRSTTRATANAISLIERWVVEAVGARETLAANLTLSHSTNLKRSVKVQSVKVVFNCGTTLSVLKEVVIFTFMGEEYKIDAQRSFTPSSAKLEV